MSKDLLTYAFAEITKAEKTVDGNVMVEGIVASTALDLDQQRMNAGFLKRAMPEWFKWANIREQHSAVAAGVGTEMTSLKGDKYHIKALIVDPGAKEKCLSDPPVYKGFSIGIKNAHVVKSATAPKGEIMDGNIVEISLTDRPANPEAKMTICKSAGGSAWLPVDTEGNEISVDTFTGKWLTADLHKSALATAEDILAGDFDGEAEDELAVIAQMADLGIAELMTLKSAALSGSTEQIDISGLERAYEAITFFAEAADSDADLGGREAAREAMNNYLAKSAGPDGTVDLSKTVEAAVTKAVSSYQERIEALEEELAEVKARPVDGGPVTRKISMPHVAKSANAGLREMLTSQASNPSMSPLIASLTHEAAANLGD